MNRSNGKSKTVTQNGSRNSQEPSKVGTWISVAIVGVVILATYFVLYGLYMARV